MAKAKRAKCFYVPAPKGKSLVCVEKARYGYSAWFYSSPRGAKFASRLPVSIGNAKSMAEAVTNARSFMRELKRKSSR